MFFFFLLIPNLAVANPLIISEQWLQNIRIEQGNYLVKPIREQMFKAASIDLSVNCTISADYTNRLTRIILTGLINSDLSYIFAAKAKLLELCSLDYWYRGDYGPICDLWCATASAEAALSYNWLYDYLSESERSFIVQSIKQKAIDIYLFDVNKNSWHVTNKHNWGGVVNGNMLITALALEDRLPECVAVKSKAQKLLKNYWNHFSREGGWDEGIAYLWYGLDAPAFAAYLGATTPNQNCAKSAHWVRIFTSPSGTIANFSDSNEICNANSSVGYLALRYNDPEAISLWTSNSNAIGACSAKDLIYASSLPGRLKSATRHIPELFIDKDINWGVIRNADNTAWCAIKGGSLNANHSHVDLGSFIYVSDNQVIICDPGCPRPYPTDYFNPLTRYSSPYIRLQSHSSIDIKEEPQTVFDTLELDKVGANSIACKITRKSGSWTRTFTIQNNHLVVTDLLKPRSKWDITVSFPYKIEQEIMNPKFNEMINPKRITDSHLILQREVLDCIPQKTKLVQFKSRIVKPTTITWRF